MSTTAAWGHAGAAKRNEIHSVPQGSQVHYKIAGQGIKNGDGIGTLGGKISQSR
jgi:hypothetical protein